jgi:hypothetical protein
VRGLLVGKMTGHVMHEWGEWWGGGWHVKNLVGAAGLFAWVGKQRLGLDLQAEWGLQMSLVACTLWPGCRTLRESYYSNFAYWYLECVTRRFAQNLHLQHIKSSLRGHCHPDSDISSREDTDSVTL